MTRLLAFPPAAGVKNPGALASLNRRLTDKILIAFHQACEQQDAEVAKQLLSVLDFMWERDQDAPWGRRGNVNFLVPARERYQHLVYVTTPRLPEPAEPA
jgi:hypothetical protein